MNAKNLVVLDGRITKDIELRTTQSGVPVARFSVAVNRPKKSGEEPAADFINVTAWRNTAEFASKYFHKGDAMKIIGTIQTGSYTDSEGNTRNSFEVIADSIEFPLTQSKKNDTTSDKNESAGNFEEVESGDDLPF